MAASKATSTDNFSAVHQEILAATRPAATAPGNNPGTVHIQNHFIRKIPSAKIPAAHNAMDGSPKKRMSRNFIYINFNKLIPEKSPNFIKI